MTTALAPQYTQRNYTWTNFKAVVAAKKLLLQYDTQETVVYQIWGYDDPEVHVCIIWQGTVPDSVIAGSGYTQAQNDTDKADFVTNYLSQTNLRIDRTDKFGDPVSVSFEQALAYGQVTGAFSDLTAGYVGTSATSAVAIRATGYVAQGANAQRSVKSTSALDAAAGTGMRTVAWTYLNVSMLAYTVETTTLNGTTAVNTVGTDWAFLEKGKGTTAGSTGGNQGTINVFTTTAGGGSIWGSIATGDNKTYWAHHYVLNGVTCYLTNLTGHATVAPGQITLQTTGDPTSATSVQIAVGSTYGHGCEQASGLLTGAMIGLDQLEHSFRFPVAVVGPNFIFMNERPIATTASTTYGSFEFVQF